MTDLYCRLGSLLLLIFSCSTAAAQDSTIVLSRFEEFSTSRGRLLKMESVSTGNFGNLYSEFVSATDLNSKEIKTALRFRTSWGLSINVVEKNWIYVDREQIPLVLTALDTMKKQLQATNFTPERSFSITTSNDVRLSLRYEDGILTGGRGIHLPVIQAFTLGCSLEDDQNKYTVYRPVAGSIEKIPGIVVPPIKFNFCRSVFVLPSSSIFNQNF